MKCKQTLELRSKAVNHMETYLKLSRHPGEDVRQVAAHGFQHQFVLQEGVGDEGVHQLRASLGQGVQQQQHLAVGREVHEMNPKQDLHRPRGEDLGKYRDKKYTFK